MIDLQFIVKEAPEGGFTARAVGVDIFTEADDLQSLQTRIRDAVRCHLDPEYLAGPIRLHIIREELLHRLLD